MSLLDRLNLLIRSEFNDLGRSDKIGGAVHDMESSLKDARRQTAELRIAEKQLIARIRGSREKAATWEDRAVMAVKGGHDDLAREALRQKNKTLAELEELRDKLDEQRAYIKDMERAMEALEHKVQGTRARVADTPSAVPSSESAWDAEFRRRTGGRPGQSTPTDAGVGAFEDLGNKAFEAFDRMAEKIRGFEARVDAQEAFEDPLEDPRRRALDDSFRKLEERRRSDDDLADLKKKFS